MTDLVVRLRAYAGNVQEAVGENRLAGLVTEAADEMERLSVEVDRLRRHAVELEKLVDDYKERWRRT